MCYFYAKCVINNKYSSLHILKAKDFKCDQCDKDFKSENGLKIHVEKTHNKVDSDIATPEHL